jgi:sugar phosphate isomerase/epimerase
MALPQISLGTWAFLRGPFTDDPWSLERVLDFAAEAGYEGVELSGYRPHAHYEAMTPKTSARPCAIW